jgi:tetratricopeptide (TPR) repeat protein
MGVLVPVVALGACGVCGSGGASGDASSCRDRVHAEDYRAAAPPCDRAFASTADPELGVRAARAHYFLGDDDAVLALVAPLGDGHKGGTIWHLAARVHDRRHETEAARAAYARALDRHTAVHDHAGAAADAQMLSTSYRMATRYREALGYARTGLDEAQAAHDADLEGSARANLGDIYYEVGYAALAEREYRSAASLWAGDAPRLAALRIKEGEIDETEHRTELARVAYRAVLELVAPEDAATLRAARLNLAALALLDGHVDDADRYLVAVRAALDQADDRQGRIAYLYHAAGVALARRELDAAARDIDDAVRLDPVADWSWNLDDLRGRVLEARGDRAGAEAAYRRSIDTLEAMRRALGPDELKAWFLAPRRRPYEALFELVARQGRALDALAIAERTRARDFVDRLIAASAAAVPAAATATTVADGLDALRSLVPLVASTEPPSLESALRAVAHDRVLGYFQARGRIWLLVVASGEVRVRELAASGDAVAALIDRLLAAPDDLAAAARLGDVLLPADALPPAGVPIYLLIDAALERVPFAALRRADRWLVEDHATAVVPNLATLAALHGPQGDAAAEAPVVLGDAAGDLPAASGEAARVAARAGVAPHLGRDATIDRLRAGARASLLHVAVHVGLGADGARFELADGNVSARQVLEWRLRPRLVVLAGCASGASPPGTWGSLGAAFLASGSRQVLVTSRSVDDRATATFIDRFYQEGGASDAAGALARTQRAFARTLPPSRWAFLFLIGNAGS